MRKGSYFLESATCQDFSHAGCTSGPMSGPVCQDKRGQEQPGWNGAGQGAPDPVTGHSLLGPVLQPQSFWSRQNKEQMSFASGFQQGPSPRVWQSGTCGRSTERLTGDQEAHLPECQGFPATFQQLEILANSSVFKFLSRAEVSLSFPFCRNLQLVYLIKHCKSCR